MTAVPPSGAITGQVFFAVLVRDPDSGKDVKRRSHLEFQFTKDLTVGDVIEAVSGHVKKNGGRTATSRRSSALLVFDIESKQLVPLADRAMRLLTHPVVQVSLKTRGSIALLIDDHRPGRGSFEPRRATPELLRHPSVQAAIASPRGRPQQGSDSAGSAFSPRIVPEDPAAAAAVVSPLPNTAASAVWARSPSPNDPRHSPNQQHQQQRRTGGAEQRRVMVDPTPHETAKALLEAEMAGLRSTRQSLGYPHWVDLLPRTPPTYKRWMKTIERERDAVASYRQTLTQEASEAVAAAASVAAECQRIEKDTRDFDEACLKRARDFDRRALLESKLGDLRAMVKEQAATEKELLAAIEEAYVANSNAAAAAAALQRSTASSSNGNSSRHLRSPSPPQQPASPSNVWPSFAVAGQPGNGAASPSSSPRAPAAATDPNEVRRAAAARESYGGRAYTVAGRSADDADEEGPDAQALRISSLWGCTPEDLMPSPPGNSQLYKQRRHDDAPAAAAPSRGVSPVLRDHRHGEAGHANNDGEDADDADLDSGLNMLPADLTTDVRALLARSERNNRAGGGSPAAAAAAAAAKADSIHHTSAREGDSARPVDGSHSSSSIAMRLLASDLDAFLATDGADSESRHALLLRVQELRSRIGGTASSSASRR